MVGKVYLHIDNANLLVDVGLGGLSTEGPVSAGCICTDIFLVR